MAEDIKNNIPEEEEASIIVLEDDLGNEVEFEYLDVIEYEGVEYLYLIPANEEDGDEVVILKITSVDDENEMFEGIEDEELLETLFETFKNKWKDEFNFE
ncbi:MAG: DUF1292 domain-containing protein [Ruminococcus sp.]|nr:DUF1292 domain-containing protein [Ruminococcus sp.]